MKIVVGVDGSKYGRWAVEWVDHLPLSIPYRLEALHVVDDQSIRAPLVPQPVPVWHETFFQKEVARRIDGGRRVSRETNGLLSKLGLKGKVVTERGLIGPTFLNRAKGKDSLIVVGSRGLDALDRFMLGSISTKLVHQAASSVLVVKQKPRPIVRVVVATDGSRASGRAVDFLIKKMLPLKMEDTKPATVMQVVVMHVMPFLRYPELKQTGTAIVQHTAERLEKAGYRVEQISKLGNPANEIIKLATRRKTDLIITGGRGLGTVGRMFLGSVSSKLVHHSPCSVLVVK